MLKSKYIVPEKFSKAQIPRSEIIQKVMDSSDQLEKLCLEKIRLMRELKLAVICEKSEALYLSVFVDRNGLEHFIEHNESIYLLVSEYEMPAIQDLKTYPTKKFKDNELKSND